MQYIESEKQIWAKRGGRMVLVHEASDDILKLAFQHQQDHNKVNKGNIKAVNYWGYAIQEAVSLGVDLTGFCLNIDVQKGDCFRNAFDGIDLSNGRFIDAEFKHFKFRKVKFVNAILDGAIFQDCGGSDIEFNGASMKSCRIQNFKGSSLSFISTNLDDARISCSELNYMAWKATSLRNILAVASKFSFVQFDHRSPHADHHDKSIHSDIDFESASFLACLINSASEQTITLRTTLNDQRIIDLSGSMIKNIDIQSQTSPVHIILDSLPFNDQRLTAEEKAFLKGQPNWMIVDKTSVDERSKLDWDATEEAKSQEKKQIEHQKAQIKDIEIQIQQLECKLQARLGRLAKSALGTHEYIISGNGSRAANKIIINDGPFICNSGKKMILPDYLKIIPAVPTHMAEAGRISTMERGYRGIESLLNQIELGIYDIHHAKGMADVLNYGDLLTRVFLRASALYADTCAFGRQQKMSLADTLRPLDNILKAHGYMPRERVSLLDWLWNKQQDQQDGKNDDMRGTFSYIEETLSAHASDMLTRVRLFESLNKLFGILGDQMRRHAVELENAKIDPKLSLDNTVRDCKLHFNASAQVSDILQGNLGLALEGEGAAAMALRNVMGLRVPIVSAAIGEIYARESIAASRAANADTIAIVSRVVSALGLSTNRISGDDIKLIEQLCTNVVALRDTLGQIDAQRSAAMLELKAVEMPSLT